jgi:hypothetical protein
VDTDTHELVRVLAAFATADCDLARKARVEAERLLGPCEGCRRGWPLSSINPDVHVESLAGGVARACERAERGARNAWDGFDAAAA